MWKSPKSGSLTNRRAPVASLSSLMVLGRGGLAQEGWRLREGFRWGGGRPRSDAPTGGSVLSDRASIALANHTLIRLAELIHSQWAERRGRSRRLGPVRRTPQILTHTRSSET